MTYYFMHTSYFCEVAMIFSFKGQLETTYLLLPGKGWIPPPFPPTSPRLETINDNKVIQSTPFREQAFFLYEVWPYGAYKLHFREQAFLKFINLIDIVSCSNKYFYKGCKHIHT